MFKTSKELKEFIIWARSAGVQQLSVGKVAIVFSPVAMAEAVLDYSPFDQAAIGKTELKNTSKDLVDTLPNTEADKKEEDDLLFYSAR
jgi:hypothetical protein